MAGGLGAIALASLLERDSCQAAPADSPLSKQPKRGVATGGILHQPHHPARAKRVIHIFSPGGVSQVDTLDYKPALEKLDGKRLTGKGTIDTFFGKVGVLRKSFYKFQQHGKSGSWFSSL
ncbi:MAG: DUF1501 domain-containing protein, partial [Planctomycetaceae bacterium]|nr:DUF1501 domain-containing protein [Planctomycetaceae bacterium]